MSLENLWYTPIVDGPDIIAPPPPPTGPAEIMIGLIDRKGNPTDTGAGPAWSGIKPVTDGYVKGMVKELNWSAIEPTQGNYVGTAIDSAMTAATSLGIQLKLRILLGSEAPSWAKNLVTSPSPTVLTLSNPSGVNYTLGHIWDPDYTAAAVAFLDWLKNYVNPSAAPAGPLYDVDMVGAMGLYPEPMIHHNKTQPNVDQYVSAGYTLAADIVAQQAIIDAHAGFLVASSLACNPYQVANIFQTSPGGINLSVSLSLMDYTRASLGGFAVLGNDSDRIASGWPSADMSSIYTKITTLGPPSYIQTAQPNLVGDLYATCQNAVGYGVTYIELPGTTASYTAAAGSGMTPAQFDTINAGLAANAATIGY